MIEALAGIVGGRETSEGRLRELTGPSGPSREPDASHPQLVDSHAGRLPKSGNGAPVREDALTGVGAGSKVVSPEETIPLDDDDFKDF